MQKIVILAGGSGSRLWPYSRRQYPKQILKLFDNKSLLQLTCERFSDVGPDDLVVVTNEQQKFLVKQELAEIGLDRDNIVLEEPFARNTAAAICLAALSVDPENTMVVLPSDHIIIDTNAFSSMIKRATDAAANGYLVTIGITPTYPETGYGYIQCGDEIKDGVCKVESFREKPDLETAEQYIKSGNTVWNSGMFVWTAGMIISEFKKHNPQLLDHVRKYMDSNDPRYYFDAEDISIDYAILEKSKNVAVIRADFAWSDLGSWKSVFDIMEKDSNGNVANGSVELIDAKNVFVHNTTKDRTTAVIGLSDVTVIDTDDAVLVCHIDKTQDIKQVVNQLKENHSEMVETHRTVFRPWGYYKILEEADYFKSKRIVIYPGQSISLQYHKHRHEAWTIVSGTATVIRGNEELELTVGQSVSVPPGFRHRIINKSELNVELIEVQTGSYFGEDDIIRLEDQYNRENPA